MNTYIFSIQSMMFYMELENNSLKRPATKPLSFLNAIKLIV